MIRDLIQKLIFSKRCCRLGLVRSADLEVGLERIGHIVSDDERLAFADPVRECAEDRNGCAFSADVEWMSRSRCSRCDGIYSLRHFSGEGWIWDAS